MASFTPSPIHNSLVLLFLLCSLWSGFASKVEGTRKCDLTSFLDFKGNEKVAYLPLVHKDAPCSLYLQGGKGKNGSDSDTEILGQDEKRENLIKSLPKRCKDIKDLKPNGANYLVQVKLDGQEPWLSFDTGSVLTWTKANKSCLTTKPCKCQNKGSTFYKQYDDGFSEDTANFHESQCANIACEKSGGVEMGCPEDPCPLPPPAPAPAPGHDDPSVNGFKQQYNHSEAGKCHYKIRYGTVQQGECSAGYLGSATLDLGELKKTDFLFGCANSFQGHFEQEDGILGLGNDEKLSIVSQIRGMYGKKFSYCIPPDDNSPGFLRFGHHESQGKNVPKQDMVVKEGLIDYRLKLECIEVDVPGATPCKDNFDVVVDSGNTYTRLPEKLFDNVEDKFYRSMGDDVEKVGPKEDFTACYKPKREVEIPIIFKFTKFSVPLPKNGITVQKYNSSTKETYTCLAFIKEKDKERDYVIWGSYQQKGIQVNIDIDDKKIWFDHDRNNNHGGNSVSF